MIPISETDKKLLSDIELYGWHVITVPEDELGPNYGYTVGLFHSFKHPEIIIIGLDLIITHFLINKLGDNIRDGLIIKAGQFYTNIIDYADCYFTNVDSVYIKEYVNYNEWFYNDKKFSLLQCIYPTINGIFPWQKEYVVQTHTKQPILGYSPTE